MRNRLLFVALSLVFGLVTAVGLAEAVLAWRAPDSVILPFYNELHPYVMFRPPASSVFEAPPHAMSHEQTPVRHYTNADGLRVEAPDYDLPRSKPVGQLRVAVLGASAIQLGSTYQTTLPGALRQALRERYPGRDIEVINAGIQSCVSRQSIAHLLFTVVDYEPDVVLLYDGVNDLGLPLTYDSRPNYPYNFQTMVEAWDAYRSAAQDPLWRTLLNRSRLYAAWRARFEPQEGNTTVNTVALGLSRPPHSLSAQQVLDSPDYVRDHVAAYLANWSQLLALSDAYGYEPICVLQPTGGFDREYAIPIMQQTFGMEAPVAEEWIDAFAVLYAEADRQIETLQRKHPRQVILNLRGYLAPARDNFWDTVHVYDEVNRKLAERILESSAETFETRLGLGN
ncbi:MAG: SGNH/GDSL hydrolase family protein [Acidobacteria bacterium]|nr:SGNH/GDSL hydrolase family protein [Acidobacteriota bacterium]